MKLCIYLNKLKIKSEKIIVKVGIGQIHKKSEESQLKNENCIKLHEEADPKCKEILKQFKTILLNS